MQQSLAFSMLFPAALFAVMLGVGLSLRVENFLTVFVHAKATAVALLVQLVILPCACLLIVRAFDLPPVLGIGLMLLSATPGGPSATIFTHFAGGDATFSIGLTTINALLSLVWIPLVLLISSSILSVDAATLTLQFDRLAEFLALVLLPALLGSVLQRIVPNVARRLAKPVNWFAGGFLLFAVLFSVVTQFDVVLRWGAIVGGAALTFNLLSLALGFFLPRVASVPRPLAIASMFEIGVHNAAFAITLAMSETLLHSPEMAVPPGIYAVIAYLTAGLATLGFRHVDARRDRQS